MESIILHGDSKDDLNLLVKLARKLGLEVSVLSKQAYEDISMVNAIKKGKTGNRVDTNKFIHDLKK